MQFLNPSPTIYECPVIDFSKNGCVWQIDNFFTDEGLRLLWNKRQTILEYIEKSFSTLSVAIPNNDELVPSRPTKNWFDMMINDYRIFLEPVDFDISKEVLSLYHSYRPLSVFGNHKMTYPNGFDIKVRTQLGITLPRSLYAHHSDAEWKFMSMIIYLGESGDGTRFLPYRDSNYSSSIEIPWKNNCGYFFFSTDSSWHFYQNTSWTDLRSALIVNVVPTNR